MGPKSRKGHSLELLSSVWDVSKGISCTDALSCVPVGLSWCAAARLSGVPAWDPGGHYHRVLSQAAQAGLSPFPQSVPLAQWTVFKVSSTLVRGGYVSCALAVIYVVHKARKSCHLCPRTGYLFACICGITAVCNQCLDNSRIILYKSDTLNFLQ